MLTKGEKFLTMNHESEKLFKEIEEEVLEIIRPYKTNKIVRVENPETGVLTVKMQSEFKSSMVQELNTYFGFLCTISKDDFSIRLKWEK